MKKYSIYVDLGWREPTTLTIVNHGEERHMVGFRSFNAREELDETIDLIVRVMDEFGVTAESIYVPYFPAVEAKLQAVRPSKLSNPSLEIL